jgi:hypothetical protein
MKRSAEQFARGQRGGILTTVMLASANTAPIAAANCPARSRRETGSVRFAR